MSKLIKIFNLNSQYKLIKKQIDNSLKKVLLKQNFIMGEEVSKFENILSKKFQVKHVITCANGTDALSLAIKSLNLPKNSVIFVPNFSYVASAEVISSNNLIPFFVDINFETFNLCTESLQKNINLALKRKHKIKAIISVDLFGLPSDHKKITKIAKKHNLKYIIDGAQSLGSKLYNKFSCSYGDIYTTSFFPTKTLGCYGDGGAIFTNNNKIFREITSLKFHGKEKGKNNIIKIGVNSRLDTIQASILIEKMKIFFNELNKRKSIVNFFYKNIKNKKIILPKYKSEFQSAFGLFTIKVNNRKKMINYLNKNHIQNSVYYPKTFIQQPVYKNLKNFYNLNVSKKISKICLSIPANAYLKQKDVKHIVKVLNEF